MTEQKPSIGRIVHYTLSEADAEAINRRRADAARSMADHRQTADGSQVHVGNQVREGEAYPMVITRVWGGTGVNGQVLLDGNDTYWATSRAHDDEGAGYVGGTWHWPPRV